MNKRIEKYAYPCFFFSVSKTEHTPKLCFCGALYEHRLSTYFPGTLCSALFSFPFCSYSLCYLCTHGKNVSPKVSKITALSSQGFQENFAGCLLFQRPHKAVFVFGLLVFTSLAAPGPGCLRCDQEAEKNPSPKEKPMQMYDMQR